MFYTKVLPGRLLSAPAPSSLEGHRVLRNIRKSHLLPSLPPHSPLFFGTSIAFWDQSQDQQRQQPKKNHRCKRIFVIGPLRSLCLTTTIDCHSFRRFPSTRVKGKAKATRSQRVKTEYLWRHYKAIHYSSEELFLFSTYLNINEGCFFLYGWMVVVCEERDTLRISSGISVDVTRAHITYYGTFRYGTMFKMFLFTPFCFLLRLAPSVGRHSSINFHCLKLFQRPAK